ncbi:MAG: hypothetical protein SFW62_02705 [Alphaproteobacteria bacterium]|nr:hypothetical protein [Alphaproteobacteria bacterium]
MTVLLRLAAFVCVGFWAAMIPAYAAEAPVLAVRAGVHPDFDRVVVDWPKRTGYSIRREGDRVTVQFNAPGQANWREVTAVKPSRLSNFASASDKDGNLTISFTVDTKFTVKDFTSGNSVVFDIAQAPAPATQATAKPPVTPIPPKETPKETVKEEPKKPPEPAAVTTPVTPPASQPTAAPSVTATPAAPATPAPEPPKAAETAAPAPAPATPVAVTPSANTAPGKSISAQDIGDTPLLVATLDPRTPVRAAVYQRGGYAYILFDRKLMLDLDTLTAGQPPPRTTLEPLELPKSSGFRFTMPPDTEIRATRTGTAWQVFAAHEQPDVPVSATLVAQPDFALGARFLLPLPDAPDPIRLTDPVVGDDLLLVPLEQSQAFSVARKMADFQILPAAQGLVIKPLTEKLIVRAVTDGIEITSEGGLRASSSHDTGSSRESSQRAKAAAAGKSMFNFNAWRGKPDETFTQTRQRLQQTIVDVPETERNRARLELGRFYFAHGYGEEASAFFAYLTKQVPDLAAHADFRALVGAAKILAWRAEEGLVDLNTPQLSNQPEIELWEAVALAELRNWKDAEEKFALTENMLHGYPEPFYSRFYMLAIESALAQNKNREAADWLDRLDSGRHSEGAEAGINYLYGVLYAREGKADKAQQAWKKAAATRDRLYKTRAEMALVDLGVSTRSLTPAQAADRFEALRFAWRGDDLEIDTLHRLGQYYIQSKNVKAGLNTLSRAVQLAPKSPLVPQIKEEMSGIFHDIFLADLGSDLSALDALTLYQQYRGLMPTGADGNAVMRNLAERLVAIDLLDQAADLLEDLVKNRLQGEEKGRVSARLAAIRLLDHKPEAALAGLDMGKDSSYPTDLQNERTLLRAKALSELNKDEEALALLNDNTHEAARILRADITMRAQHWGDATKALLELIGPPPAAGTALNLNQASWLVNAAIALSMAGDQEGLHKLAVDYGPSVATLPQNDTFRVLTQPEKADQLRDIAAAQSKIADVDMFQGFLNSYRQTAAPNANKNKK